jgi:predicted nucleic acid-binding protein
MRKLKLYLDTSVWNFYYADDSPEKMEITKKFFDEIRSEKYEIYISELVTAEIDEAGEEKQKRLKTLIEKYQPFEIKKDYDVGELSGRYIASKIVPARYEADLIHIAFAVANDLDVVISWNLRHIVKLKTRLEVNGINKIEGYKEIEICTPEEVIEYDK